VKNASNLVVLAMLSTQIPVIFFRRSENEIKQHAIMPVCRNKICAYFKSTVSAKITTKTKELVEREMRAAGQENERIV